MVSYRRGVDEEKIKTLINKYTDPNERLKFQKIVEDLLDLEPGSVLLYVTKRDVGKAARTKCFWFGKVLPLDEIEIEHVKKELSSLRDKYSDLWRLYVFMDRDVFDKYCEYVAGYCKSELFPINDVEDEKCKNIRQYNETELYLSLHPQREELSVKAEQEISLKIGEYLKKLKSEGFTEKYYEINIRSKLDEIFEKYLENKK